MTSTPWGGPAVSLRGVSKTYGSSRTPANDSITLDLRSGELVALIGHNGAGKTTLLNQIVGAIRPTAGHISFEGRSLVERPDLARRICSKMPQLHAPLTGVTPLQAVASIARLRGAAGRNAQRAAEGALSTLDISQWARTSGEKLSGGLRRLTSYAMAVVTPPPVLLLDEPTNDVDPVRRPLIWRHLRQLADAGHIVVVVTHNLLEVERIADRFVVMQYGKVLADQTSSQLAERSGAATMSVHLLPSDDEVSTPPAVKVESSVPGELQLTLAKNQVLDAVEWTLALAEAGRVSSYSLAPAALEAFYGGAVNDD
jgi:ABC-2 type transport system ATP-binding protein